MRHDLVGLAEAAYRLDLDDDGWLAQVVSAAEPVMDQGHGVYAFEFDASGPNKVALGHLAGSVNATVSPELVRQWHSELSDNAAWAIFRSPTPAVATIEARLKHVGGPEVAIAMRKMCQPMGIVDQLTVRATDPTHQGIALASPLVRGKPSPLKESATWRRLSIHIASGHRLRRALRNQGTSNLAAYALETADAVFSADGRCAHAQGAASTPSARERLRQATLAIDRARSRLRQDPDEALAVWQGLCAGTWSLVDCFDTDGRRYIVARRNTPEARDPRGLSPRERQVAGFAALGYANKAIAYALGLSVSTANGYLRSAMRKLGLESRLALVDFFRRAPAEPGGPV